MLKKLTATLIASLSIISPNSALAGEMEDHRYLWETLPRIGVTRHINDPEYCSKIEEYSGMYDAYNNILVVCQDNGRYDGEMVGWTDNDLDTLRHESHHIVQDCSNSTLADIHMDPMFSHDELKEFIAGSGLTKEKLEWIARNYAANGADEDVIIKEFEAFAVALSVNPRIIADKLVEFCGVI